MLPETITLSYDPTGGSTPGTFVYDKKTHSENEAFYRDHTSLVSGAALQDNFLLRIVEPKRSASSYGTTRHFMSVRLEQEIPTPVGTQTIAPCLIKIETSTPVGFSAAGKRALFERVRALLQHEEFANFYFSNEC